MRSAIPAFVMVAIIAAAQPAGAIDDGFRGLLQGGVDPWALLAVLGRHAAGAPAVTARALLPTDRRSASISSEK